MTAAFVFGQNVHFRFELGVRLDRARLSPVSYTHLDVYKRQLDNDTRYGRFSQFLSQVLTYFKIAVQVVSEFFGVRKPGRLSLIHI